MAMLLTPARLTDTTARRGLAAVSSSAPGRGSVVVTDMDTVASTATAAGTVTATAEVMDIGAAMVMAADTVEDTLADITVPQ